MCEYRGVSMTCTDAWAQYERDVQASQQGAGSNQGSASASPQVDRQPSQQSQVTAAPQDGSSPVVVPINGSSGSLLRELQTLAQGHDTWSEVYLALLPVWNANADSRGTTEVYEWMVHLSNLSQDEFNRGFSSWENGQWVRKDASAAAVASSTLPNGAGSVEVAFERSGVRIQGLSLADGGTTVKFTVQTGLRKGLPVTVEHQEWDIERSRWVSAIDRLKVDAKGAVSASLTQVRAWQYVFIKDSKGKTLARLKTTA